jgi:lipopolysaccharide transport system permease protein
MGPAIIESLTRALILILAVGIILQQLQWTTLLLPVIYLPLILFSLGVSWFVASIGVFFRDIRHLITVLLRVLLFATPIFYSLASVPEPFHSIISLNPLTIFVDHFRRVILWGELPDWPSLLIVSAVSFVICWLGYLWFMRTRRLFADVV